MSWVKSDLLDLRRVAGIVAVRGITLLGKILLTIAVAVQLGADDLGLFGLILGMLAFLPVIAHFGLIAVVEREVVAQDPAGAVSLLKRYARVVATAYLALVPVALALGTAWGMVELALLALLLALLEQANNDLFTVLISRSRPILANYLFLLRHGLWIFAYLALAVSVPGFATIANLVGVWIVFQALSLAGFFVALRDWPWRAAPAGPTWTWFTAGVRQSRDYFVATICVIGYQFTDRYVLAGHQTLADVGTYLIFWSVTNALANLIQAGILSTAKPRLLGARLDDDRAAFRGALVQTMLKSVAVALAMSAAAAALLPIGLDIAGLTDFVAYMPLFWLMLVALTLRSASDVLWAALYSARRDRALARSEGLILAANLVLLLVLVGAYGIYGAALAQSLTYALAAALRAALLLRRPGPF